MRSTPILSPLSAEGSACPDRFFFSKKWITCLVFLVFLVTTSYAQSVKPLTEQNLVHQGDTIDVDVVGGFEFDWRGTLSPEGFLDGLNNFGEPIYGLCRTEEAIAADIVKAYSKILREPVVVVRIIDRSNRALVLLEGAVKMPSRFRLNRRVNLQELLVYSGGLSDNASGEIRIFRPNGINCPVATSNQKPGPLGNQSEILTILIKDLLAGNPSANPAVLSGDLISVPKENVIYVVGGVGNPKQISARTGISLSRAILSSGGLSKASDETRITIYRKENGNAKVIDVDLRKVKSGEVADPVLQALDIIDVPIKGSEKRRYPPVMTGGGSTVRTLPPLRIVD